MSDNRFRSAFQPVFRFPKPNMQLIAFIKMECLTAGEQLVLDWFIEHISRNNRILVHSKLTIVDKICARYKRSHPNKVYVLLRKFVKLGILNKVNAHEYILSPYIANMVCSLPEDAYGFRKIGLKAIYDKGYADWKKEDDKQKKDFPLLRKSLQAAQFHVMKEYLEDLKHTNGVEENMTALQKVEKLEALLMEERARNEERHRELLDILRERNVPVEVQAEVKRHLTVVKPCQ